MKNNASIGKCERTGKVISLDKLLIGSDCVGSIISH